MEKNEVIVPFRASPRGRLDSAISCFNANGRSLDLYESFVELLNEGQFEASYFLAMFHEDGTPDISQDLEKAFFYYKLSADRLGYVEGGLAVARMYYHGRGVEKDFEKAYSLYARIADGMDNAIASYMRGRMLMRGEGIPRDAVAALFWLRKGVILGNVFAMVNLSEYYAIQGRWLSAWAWRLRAGLRAMLIAWHDMKDIRLRQG